MPSLISSLPMAYNKIAMANRLKSMREKLRKIHEEFRRFEFNEGRTSMTTEQHYDIDETTSHPHEEIIGRDGEKQKIIKLLSKDRKNDEIVRIVPIYGLGGMGKSTLAQLVYNDERSIKKYDHRIWVYVSKDFNLLKIGNSIISQLPTHRCHQNRDTRQVIQECLGNLLHGKKVLIVLDDLWEEKITELIKLRSMLDIKGSMIDVIVTTRKKEIAIKVSTSKPYELQALEYDFCWEIIKRSSKFDLKSNQEKLKEIGLDIAKKCGGMALAAKAIGFMLKSIDDLSGWTKMNNCDIWNESSEDNNVLRSLKFSYERMPPQLRICFSYCAIFPKGHNIFEDDLVHQWIALDFIDERSKGKEYIKILLGMCFLQVSKLPSTKKVVQYTMHDLVHDLARLTMAEELFVFDVTPDRDTRAHKYCRYSLLRKYDHTMKLANILPSKMRALRFSDSGYRMNVPSSAFSFVKYLHTLDFSECSRILLPASIGRLKQLRYLNAPRIQNKSLPNFITELSKLQYLNIHGSSKISALPESIGNLGCLEYLRLSGCSSISRLPESFGDLKCMVHLDMSGCSGIRELPCSLGNVKNLQHLELSGCYSVRAIPESLCGLTQLQYLNLSNCTCLGRLPEAIGSLVNLQYLNMSSCHQIRELPESLMKLQNLLHLAMSQCSNIGSDELHVLGNLTSLKYLSLNNMYCRLHKEGDDRHVVGFIGTLTNLEHLDLSANIGLTCLPESIGNLKRLHTLDLSNCNWLKSLPEAIGSLVNLQYLNMRWCRKIRELPESLMKLQNLLHLDMSQCSHIGPDELHVLGNLTSLKYLSLNGTHCHSHKEGDDRHVVGFIGTLTNLEHLDLSSNDLTCLPESIGNLKRLHTLDLSGCRGLKSLPKSICALELKSLVLEGCLDELMDHASSLVYCSRALPIFKVCADDVNGCSNLHVLGGDHRFSELRILCLENARSLEEANKVNLVGKHNLSELTLSWTVSAVDRHLEDKDLLGQLVPPICLKHMVLEGYSSTGFPCWVMEISHHLTNLVSIGLQCLFKCSKLPPLGQLRHLQNLWLHRLPSIKKIDREFCGGKGAFRRLSSFVVEGMKGLEEWNTTYSVVDGVVEFMFPELDRLAIVDCPRLRLKPCPPVFRECRIWRSNHVISSLEEVDKISDPSSRSRGTKLGLVIEGDNYCQSMRLFHHFPALQELLLIHELTTSLPEGMRHLTSLQSLRLVRCHGISALPEWLGDLSSLKTFVIEQCGSIKSLPSCIHQLKELEKLEIRSNRELKEWCESKKNKMMLAHIKDVEFLNCDD